jgi:WD40 repeat protein
MGHFHGWQGFMIASVDADGVVKLWDVRKVAEYATINVGPQSANRCCFDPSGLVIAIASNDQRIKWLGPAMHS